MVVALTGGIASGKTAASDHFARLGAAVVDTDRIAREVVAPGTAGLDAVLAAFGRDLLDENGALDRAALRRRVFDDDAARRRLEAILHPLIGRESRRRIAAHADADYVVVVVPLLVETGMTFDAERVVVVDVPETVQVERLMRRDGIDEARARRMLDAQAGRGERLAAATDVIDNSGSLHDLEARVAQLHREFSDLSRRRVPSTPTR